jgi:glycosyltransferase involved in cell wall biosynthesis
VVDEKELQRVRHIYGIHGDYVLSVGSIQPRKNLPRLVRAYASLQSRYSGKKFPKLVLAGKCAWLYDETLHALQETGIKDSVILTGYVPESDLPALYSGCSVFVYPSFFEGFGLPPLEAMKCGAPVIVGNRTSLPEVVGDAALQVDPFDEAQIASALEQIVNDQTLRDKLRVKGWARAEMFDWRKTARRTLQIYEEVVQGSIAANSPETGFAS